MQNDIVRTATVTWITYPNFGTYLQAYALQQVVKHLGYENWILDDRRFVLLAPWRACLGRIKRWLLRKPQVKVINPAFSQFRQQYLQIDEHWRDDADLNRRYDMFLCGSDQIWTPYARKINPYYFLGFTDKKKVAYAPSTGAPRFSDDYQAVVRPLLNRFSAIGVREKSCAEALSGFINQRVEAVLDPTLLLTEAQWKEMCAPINDAEKTPYLLCYFLTPNTWYLEYAKRESRQKGLRLKVFNTWPEAQSYGDDCLDVGPAEFLGYIRNAGKVMTDSFHASIFSILFHKDFVTFKRFQDGGERDQNARIADLFSDLGLSTYFVGEDRLNGVAQLSRPDYEAVERSLQRLRSHSIQFLRKALGER